MARLADLDTARAMGRAAYERFWLKPMTADAHADALVGIYRHMLAARAAAAPALPLPAIAQPA